MQKNSALHSSFFHVFVSFWYCDDLRNNYVIVKLSVFQIEFFWYSWTFKLCLTMTNLAFFVRLVMY